MAAAQLSAAPVAPHGPLPRTAHPMSNPGYGKRSAPNQKPPSARDFAHLEPREAAIATYIDQLPDGSDISVKTLAKLLPYGQCAMGTALRRLQAAGHLHRDEIVVANETSLLWVTRTHFSRTARDADWWNTFLRGDVPAEPRRSTRSRAFILLAALGEVNRSLALPEAACAMLEPQVTEWFERGADEADLLHALTSGLPSPVHHAPSFVRRRLIDKLPPVRIAAPPPPPAPSARRAAECRECKAPGPEGALLGGLCRPCRGDLAPLEGPPGTVPHDDVRSRMSQVRAALIPRQDRPRGRAGVTVRRRGGQNRATPPAGTS
ncbi:hypothetical protein [Streptomyces sp. NPDC008125]|uniref:hypothetical protein n=1 Tax=Streptomyces sp. NPDC008125 TaxID=3364811 RepID=UPI0036DFC450